MRNTARTKAIRAWQIDLLRLSFGPYWLMQVLPWLILATALRYVRHDPAPAVQVIAMLLESLAIFLAFLAAAQCLLELARGGMRHGDWSILRQLNVASHIVLRVYLAMFAFAAAAFVLGYYKVSFYVLFAFAGLAFDQASAIGMVASSVIAAIALMMVVNVEKPGQSTVTNAIKALARNALWMVPAIVVVAAVQVGLSQVQGVARALIVQYGQSSAAPFAKNLALFLYMLAFASIRLWATLAILTFAFSLTDRRKRTLQTT